MCSLTRSLPDEVDWDGLAPYAKGAFVSLLAENARDWENVVGVGSQDVGAAVLRATSDQQASDIVRKHIEKDITDYQLAMEAYHAGESSLREEEVRALESITKIHAVFLRVSSSNTGFDGCVTRVRCKQGSPVHRNAHV